MSFLETFTLFASGVTIFGLIVGLSSVYTGRVTRQEIGGLIRETQGLIRETHTDTLTLIRETHELIARGAEATRQLIRETQEPTRQILQGIMEILGRSDERVR